MHSFRIYTVGHIYRKVLRQSTIHESLSLSYKLVWILVFDFDNLILQYLKTLWSTSGIYSKIQHDKTLKAETPI